MDIKAHFEGKITRSLWFFRSQERKLWTYAELVSKVSELVSKVYELVSMVAAMVEPLTASSGCPTAVVAAGPRYLLVAVVARDLSEPGSIQEQDSKLELELELARNQMVQMQASRMELGPVYEQA